MFVSVNGKAQEVKAIYAGGSDGVAHEITEAFGSVNGTAKRVYVTTPEFHNAFDDYSWDQIKVMATEGKLLEHFHKGDLVKVKLKTPLTPSGEYPGSDGKHYTGWYQDYITLQITKLQKNWMQLVEYDLNPFTYAGYIKNQLYIDHCCTNRFRSDWGMIEQLYTGIKEIDKALPDDMRAVLNDFHPLYKYEQYIDEEGKKRIKEEYDDCRVRPVNSCGYEYHYGFNEETQRNEYILDFSHSNRDINKCLGYWPKPVRECINHDHPWSGRQVLSFAYVTDNPYTQDHWEIDTVLDDPTIAWNWDWENYNNKNRLNEISDPEKTVGSGGDAICFVIPQFEIGIFSDSEKTA